MLWWVIASFSPLGKPADRAIYFTFVSFFFYRATAMLSAVYAVVVCLPVCLCVCVCVCHTPLLYQNG